jgi:hypothetical protein
LLILEPLPFSGKKRHNLAHNHYILYSIYTLLISMKIFTARKERPLLLVIAVGTIVISAAVTGSIFFTATPAAYAHDLTEEDILSLQIPGVAKVTICHHPPGNPENRHEITVGEPAVAGHIAEHGDDIGPCQPTPDPDL